MSRFRIALFLTALAAGLASRLQAADNDIQFNELFNLLKTNLTGADLNRAAVVGLIRQLDPQVALVGAETESATNGTPLLTGTVFDKHYGYLRIVRVAPGLEHEFTNTFQRLSATNKLKGLVVDLRFAGGQDFAAALAVADQFFPGEQSLIDWGEGWKSSTSKPEAIVLPTALLVNKHTSGAAEALAGMLRFSDIGLVLGTNTAGRASMTKELTLQTGQRVRVAIAPVRVAKNNIMPSSGLKPDIHVMVPPDDERAWIEDAHRALPPVSRAGDTNESSFQITNRLPRRRINEADLVRMSREGLTPEAEPANAPNRQSSSGPKLIINDPALARALDLLKGMAVVQQFKLN